MPTSPHNNTNDYQPVLNWYEVEAVNGRNRQTIQVFKVKAESPEAAAGYVLRTTHWATEAKTIGGPS